MLRCAITPGLAGLPGQQNSPESLTARCALLAQAGVDFVLVREKHLSAGMLAELSRGLVALCPGARVLIAGRADVAAAAGAAGVHLSSAPGELSPEQARRVLPGAWVSVSCHSLADVDRARQSGADAVLFAPVFGKVVAGLEVVAAAGLDRLREACAVAGEMPVFALGGVTLKNAPQCMEAGAAGIAGIRLFFA